MSKTTASQPTNRICPVCGAHVASTLPMCGSCVRALEREVREAHDLLAELDTELSRQSRKGDSAGRRSADRPLAFHAGASDAGTELRAAIRDLAKTAPNITGAQVLRFRDARKNATRVVDRERPLKLLGVCDCADVPLYVGPDDAEVQCRYCHETYPVHDVAAWEHLEKVVAPLSECRQHMTIYGLRRSKADVHRDLARSNFTPVHERNGIQHWRLTDVIQAAWEGGCRPDNPQHAELGNRAESAS